MRRDNTWIALTLGTLMVVACNGDDATTVATATATESDTSSTTVTATQTATMTGTDTATMTGTVTMSGTDSMSESDSTSVTATDTDVTATDTDPTATDTNPTATDTDPTATDTDPTDTDTDTDTGTDSDTDTTGMPGVCGDGVIDAGEQCDDGNNEDGDGCQANCTLPPPPVCPNEETAVKCDVFEDSPEWYQAMEMGCSDNIEETPVIYDDSMNSNNPNAWRIAKGFGTYMEMGELLYSPRGGDTFLMLSTGVISQPNGQGIVTEANNSQTGNGNNNNDDSNSLPPPISVQEGSNNGNGGTPFENCDGVNDCSDTLESAWMLGSGDPNDKAWITWKTDVPDLVESYSFSFAYFSSEWPTYVNTQFNDLLIGWQTSEAYTGNTTFIGDAPVTITSLNTYFIQDGYTGNEPQLQGTGFEQHAGTDWFGVNQNVVAGETVTFTIMIADMGDSILATMAIVDNFHWNCEACIPVDDPACTGEVPDPKCCGVVEPQ